MSDKLDVFNACKKLLEEKITIAESGMSAAQESANNETKSSAGDKYETGRAMSQNERDMYAKKLTELLGQKNILESIDPKKSLGVIASGALVTTSTGVYFVSISLGLVSKKASKMTMAISAIAPIAQAMLGKTSGECFLWQGKQVDIISVD